MESLISKITELYREFSKSPFHFFAFAVICFGGYILHTELGYIKTLFPSHNEQYFEVALRRDELINQSLSVSKETLEAEMSAIAQFHNGQYDLTRLPFTSVSITYFSGEIALTTTEVFSSRPLSTINKTMIEMWKSNPTPKCIQYSTDTIPDISYKQRIERSGLAWVSLCPLVNILDYPIGYYAMGYDSIPSEEHKVIIEIYQRTQATKIAGYLQEINE